MAYFRRLKIHFQELQKNPPPLCYAEPEDPLHNMSHWIGWIDGPNDTPYAGGRFRFTIDFPSVFPFKPPEVRFITPIFLQISVQKVKFVWTFYILNGLLH
jgi:ubiquitin-protein ligase